MACGDASSRPRAGRAAWPSSLAARNPPRVALAITPLSAMSGHRADPSTLRLAATRKSVSPERFLGQDSAGYVEVRRQ